MSTTTTTMRSIERRAGVCGGKPCIAGTRIRVWDIHMWFNPPDQSAEWIVSQFPQLSLSDVYTALAYYHAHRDEIEAEMKRAEEFVARMRAAQEPTKFSLLRDAVNGGDSVSP